MQNTVQKDFFLSNREFMSIVTVVDVCVWEIKKKIKDFYWRIKMFTVKYRTRNAKAKRSKLL